MKKIIIAICFLFVLNNSNGQIFLPPNFVPIIFTPTTFGNNTLQLPAAMPPWATAIGVVDTLQWLQTRIQAKSDSFSGKPLSVLWDSLYGLRWKIAEYDPPFDIKAAAVGAGLNNPEFNKDTLYVHDLTFYLAPISDGGVVDQIHTDLDINNLNNHTNFTVNTHVKYIKVNFQNTVKYLRSIASSDNGRRKWKWAGFQEYFWGGNIVQSVTVGEY